ncbi:MAG: phosphotransferase [Clostridia bacterium]|nr:phosphotransferase [Clostridia bacterium]
MALEKTVLDERIVSELLSKHYGIAPVSMKKLKLGSANCFRVYDGEKDYFLKEFQSSFSEKQIVQEAKLVEYLSSTNVPATRFYKTDHDEFVLNYQNHMICLEEFVEGEAYDYDNLPPHLLSSVGGMLGKLHRALKNYPLPVDMSDKWLESFSADDLVSQYDSLIQIAKGKMDDKNTKQIIDDLEYKKRLADRCGEYRKYYEGITYCSTHGDYQGCQIIFDGDKIKAVIDFSSAACLPATWELMRSYVQSSSSCRSNTIIDVAAFCEYVREYIAYSPLTKTDMIAMPYVYLFQLARSKYGYPQYLNANLENKEELLQFAFWRTKMCREVEEKAEAISNALLNTL